MCRRSLLEVEVEVGVGVGVGGGGGDAMIPGARFEVAYRVMRIIVQSSWKRVNPVGVV